METQTLCPLIEDLKTQLALLKEEDTELRKSLQWATDEVNDMRNNQNELRAKLNNSRDMNSQFMLQCVQQDLQMRPYATLKLKPSQGGVTLSSLEYEKQKLKVFRTSCQRAPDARGRCGEFSVRKSTPHAN